MMLTVRSARAQLGRGNATGVAVASWGVGVCGYRLVRSAASDGLFIGRGRVRLFVSPRLEAVRVMRNFYTDFVHITLILPAFICFLCKTHSTASVHDRSTTPALQ